MKWLLTGLLLFGGSTSFAGLILECLNGSEASSFSFRMSEDLFTDSGVIRHNFSTATVICKKEDKLITRIANKKQFSCAGMWHSDFDPAYRSNELDTPVKIDFIPIDQGYISKFMTSKSSGARMIELKCEIQ